MARDRGVETLAARARISMRAQTLGHAIDWSPFDVLTEMALGYDLTTQPDGTVVNNPVAPELRLNASKELAAFLAPKLKAIEHSGEIEHAVAERTELVNKLFSALSTGKKDDPA